MTRPVAAAAAGAAISVPRGGELRVTGEGYQPGTPVYAYLRPADGSDAPAAAPRSIPSAAQRQPDARADVGADGAVVVTVPVGGHLMGPAMLEVNGFSRDGAVRSVRLGLSVTAPARRTTTQTLAASALGQPDARAVLRTGALLALADSVPDGATGISVRCIGLTGDPAERHGARRLAAAACARLVDAVPVATVSHAGRLDGNATRLSVRISLGYLPPQPG